MKAKHFCILKEKLTTGRNFGEIMGYFMDHLCEHSEFFKLGARVMEHPTLEAALAAVADRMVGGKAVFQEMLIVRVPEHKFVHGGCLLDGKIAQFFYYEDIHVGLLAVAMSFQTGETQFARFTATPIKGDSSLN